MSFFYPYNGFAEKVMTLDACLDTRIEMALAARPATVASLAAIDELHIGGRAATRHMAAALGLETGMLVLDIGSGLGGAARYCVREYGVFVTGIDLDPAYNNVATELSRKTGLEEQTVFNTGNALNLPYANGAFDAVYSLHTAMNIADKKTLYAEIVRVLKPGGRFVLYDVLAGGNDAPMPFPLPWSSDGEDSFLIQPRALETLLQGAGFDQVRGEDRTDFARQALARVKETGKTGAIGIVHRGDAMLRIANLSMAIDDSRCEVWQFTCHLGSR